MPEKKWKDIPGSFDKFSPRVSEKLNRKMDKSVEFCMKLPIEMCCSQLVVIYFRASIIDKVCIIEYFEKLRPSFCFNYFQGMSCGFIKYFCIM